ncbi:D-alanyl-lipoteichoic acid biosynthesis protein DltD [Lapidilactobacillus wuchangensis]|uniref:D-alanyl-lipoteichoic acid biosynthesis protein DltD n=1 Tax=Lapidilactobacillus wuchangensis TaxID=2486001 RepID=UPI000F773C15|nr:D-alanyl-lipoteichoic acid biosynthesis protein DltD [Lapidilactobacillus wuchangensis]
MTNGKKLWQIFGPVLIAIVAALVIFLIPWQGLTPNKHAVKKAAVSMSTNVYRGEQIKDIALKENYVPFIGSSELSRMDPLHPSVLAEKYQRDYQTLLLGGPGSQSLNHFFTLQEMKPAIRNKKVVFIISPQWFTKGGQRPDAFGYYYSPLQAIDWVLNAKDSVATRYAARRLLAMPSGQASPMITSAIEKIAAGQKISGLDRIWLSGRQRILRNEDAFFSSIRLDNNLQKIVKAGKQLPATDNDRELMQLATKLGQENTTNNQFGIKNSFYNQRLRGKAVKNLANSQSHIDYRRSPEYGDFQLVLQQFAAENVDVQFVLPPINQKWTNYTGLSMPMWRETTAKIKKQLTSQGFNHIIDLSADGNQDYYMEDTIHLGWRGWLRMDESVKPFLTEKQQKPTYHINNYYFTKTWERSLN